MQNELNSAFEMRIAIKKKQAEQTALKLFTDLGCDLFEHGWQLPIAEKLLDAVCIFTGASDGLIANQQAGTLTIAASKGQTFPVGARIPMVGIFASVLKYPVHFHLHPVTHSRLWTYEDSAQSHTFIAPLAIKQQAVGLLAISCKSQVPTEENITALHALCGLIAQAMWQSESMIHTPDASILNQLTPREREVFALLPSGQSNAELAEKLGISAGTVKIHVERILAKLNLRDRTRAAVKAVELGYKS